MRRRRKKIIRGVALAFAIAGFAVPTAQARHLTKWGTNPIATSAASSYTAQQLRALEPQLEAQMIDVDIDVPPNTLLAGTRKISLAKWRGK